MRSRSGNIDPEEPTPFDDVIRRADQAGERLDAAVEVEDFQAVGMLLRESLISLVQALRRKVPIQDQVEKPKDADFVGWTELFMNALCPGGSNKDLRQHLKNTSKESWQLANWLTHTRSATKTASSIAKYSCQMTIGHFIQILESGRSDKIGKCPVCKSSNIRTHYDITILPDGFYYSSCGVCEWNDHLGHAGAEA